MFFLKKVDIKNMKEVFEVKVKNELGLHTRPSTAIVQLLQNCKSDVFFKYKKHTINAKSILSILMLAIRKNSKIVVTVEGEDSLLVKKTLEKAFEDKFGDK